MTDLPRPGAGCAACAARDQVIAELGRAVEELRAEVTELQRRLGHNSRNSSMPPSADDGESGREVLATVTESFREFGILPAFTGVVVSDRYRNYFHDGWEHIAGHQACLAQMVRDFEDAAESRPDAIWPVKAQRALRGLIRAWHSARGAGQREIPAHIGDPLIRDFHHAVLAGCPAFPGRSMPPPSIPAGTCWSSAATAKAATGSMAANPA